MVARINTVAFQGVDIQPIDVQVQISNGLRLLKMLVAAVLLITLLPAQAIADSVEPLSEEVAEILSIAVEDRMQDFDNHVRDLLFVSIDDTRRGIGHLRYDMADRKELFSENGWEDYLRYMAAHKQILKQRKRFSDTFPQVKAKFGSQHYETTQNVTRLSAGVRFCYGISDAYTCGADVWPISVTFTGDPEVPETTKITAWEILLGESE